MREQYCDGCDELCEVNDDELCVVCEAEWAEFVEQRLNAKSPDYSPKLAFQLMRRIKTIVEPLDRLLARAPRTPEFRRFQFNALRAVGDPPIQGCYYGLLSSGPRTHRMLPRPWADQS